MNKNNIVLKKARRNERTERKLITTKTLPHSGVIYSLNDARRHLYLKEHNLPFSQTLVNLWADYLNEKLLLAAVA